MSFVHFCCQMLLTASKLFEKKKKIKAIKLPISKEFLEDYWNILYQQYSIEAWLSD